MATGYRLGVDLGTTYTAAAIERDGRVEVCTLGDRTATIPSLALLRPSGEIVVGEAAERRAASEPTAIAREFKRRLGDPAPLVLGGVAVQPEALMAAVLRHVVNIVTTREDRPPERVVLSHPANFGPYKTGLMRTVAQLADLGGNVELVAEPQAAAISYAQRSVIEPGKVVAVYDFGGGTFDAALVRRTTNGGFDIVGQPEGLERLGGIDLDQLLVEHVLERAGATSVLDTEVDEATLAALVELRDRCQAAKEALSVDSDARIAVNLGGVSTAVRVTRDEFAELVRPRVMETVEALQRAIRNSGLSTGDIDRVLLVGGSSRIPLVADTIRATLHRPVALDANPKTAICEGAALYLATAPPATPGATTLPDATTPGGSTSPRSASRGFAAPTIAAATIAAATVAGAAAAGVGAAAAGGPPSGSVPASAGSSGAAPPPPSGNPSSTGGGQAPIGPPPGGGPPGGSAPPPGSPSFVTPPPGTPPGGPPSGGPPPGAAGDPPERGRRKVVLIGAVAALVAALIVALIIVVAGGDDKQTASTDPTSRVTTTSDETSPTPPVTTEPAPTDPPAATDAVTDPPPPTDATTTTIAPSVAAVGKTVYFAGFQIDVGTATFTPPPSEFERGKLVLDSVATNLVDRSANVGFITNTAPVTLVADGFSFPLSLTLADIPPGGKAKFTMTSDDLDTFNAATSEVDFGGPQFNGAVMPLGAGDVTTTAPRTVPLTGSTTSPNQLTVTLTQGLIQPFSPMANGGGDVTPSAVGQLFIGITAHLTFSGDFDDGVFEPVLQRPDGSTDSVFDSKTSLVNPGGQADDLYVFKIPAQSAGDYVLRFGTGRGGSVKNEIPFTLS